MNSERISECRAVAAAFDAFVAGDVITECLDEIERLHKCLRKIADSPTDHDDGANPDELRQWALDAMEDDE